MGCGGRYVGPPVRPMRRTLTLPRCRPSPPHPPRSSASSPAPTALPPGRTVGGRPLPPVIAGFTEPPARPLPSYVFDLATAGKLAHNHCRKPVSTPDRLRNPPRTRHIQVGSLWSTPFSCAALARTPAEPGCVLGPSSLCLDVRRAEGATGAASCWRLLARLAGRACRHTPGGGPLRRSVSVPIRPGDHADFLPRRTLTRLSYPPRFQCRPGRLSVVLGLPAPSTARVCLRGSVTAVGGYTEGPGRLVRPSRFPARARRRRRLTSERRLGSRRWPARATCCSTTRPPPSPGVTRRCRWMRGWSSAWRGSPNRAVHPLLCRGLAAARVVQTCPSSSGRRRFQLTAPPAFGGPPAPGMRLRHSDAVRCCAGGFGSTRTTLFSTLPPSWSSLPPSGPAPLASPFPGQGPRDLAVRPFGDAALILPGTLTT